MEQEYTEKGEESEEIQLRPVITARSRLRPICPDRPFAAYTAVHETKRSRRGYVACPEWNV